MIASSLTINSRHVRRLWIPSALLLGILSVAGWGFLIVGAQTDGGGVHGSIYTPVVNGRLGVVRDGPSGTPGDVVSRIEVPQFEVHLVSDPSGATIASTLTDVFGRFSLISRAAPIACVGTLVDG
jgi:hypothetical protein